MSSTAPAVTPPDPAPRPTWAFVATWYRVSFFGAASNKVNTFQAVLATDGATSFVMLNYGDIQWTTGIANQGDAHTGMGGIPAQAGFNSGDDVHYYNIPGSRSPAVLHIGRRSNVGIPGRWIFRVDKFTATEGPPIPMETPSTPSLPPSTPSQVPTPRRTTKERVYICE
ncbi:sushi, nidogen and EGF-like domain-containing protein 1 [Sarcoramphus papa]